MILLVDDLDDLARARLNDHPAVIDHRVAKFGCNGDRPQFDTRRHKDRNHAR